MFQSFFHNLSFAFFVNYYPSIRSGRCPTISFFQVSVAFSLHVLDNYLPLLQIARSASFFLIFLFLNFATRALVLRSRLPFPPPDFPFSLPLADFRVISGFSTVFFADTTPLRNIGHVPPSLLDPFPSNVSSPFPTRLNHRFFSAFHPPAVFFPFCS